MEGVHIARIGQVPYLRAFVSWQIGSLHYFLHLLRGDAIGVVGVKLLEHSLILLPFLFVYDPNLLLTLLLLSLHGEHLLFFFLLFVDGWN